MDNVWCEAMFWYECCRNLFDHSKEKENTSVFEKHKRKLTLEIEKKWQIELNQENETTKATMMKSKIKVFAKIIYKKQVSAKFYELMWNSDYFRTWLWFSLFCQFVCFSSSLIDLNWILTFQAINYFLNTAVITFHLSFPARPCGVPIKIYAFSNFNLKYHNHFFSLILFTLFFSHLSSAL